MRTHLRAGLETHARNEASEPEHRAGHTTTEHRRRAFYARLCAAQRKGRRGAQGGVCPANAGIARRSSARVSRPALSPLIAALALAAGPAHAGAPRLAVVTLDAPPELQFTGKSAAEAFAREAVAAGFEVVGPDAVQQQLGRAGHAALVACADDAKCLAQRGAKLDVERIVGGSLRKRGTSYRVALVHADAKTGARLGGLEREIPIATRRLQKDVASAAPVLLAGPQDATGVLKVSTDVPGADVAVDDVPAGKTPLARAVKPGKHKVKVSRDGWADAEPSWVDVPANEIVEHRPRLYPIPARERPNPSPTAGHGTAVQVLK